VQSRLLANPGSVGQPKHGRPEACYAIWEKGELTLASTPYDAEATIKKLQRLPISEEVFQDLAFVLRNGRVPSS
jgi:protein phosphatase